MYVIAGHLKKRYFDKKKGDRPTVIVIVVTYIVTGVCITESQFSSQK